MDYLLLKWVHIISSTILFGTGIGSAFFMFMANRRKDIDGIAFVTRHVVIADWTFTTPAVVIQFFTGIWLASISGYAFSDAWIILAIILYILVGICWLPVVWLQIQMSDMAQKSYISKAPLPARYWRFDRWWIALGSIAFPLMLVIFYLMIFKPQLSFWS